jgi:HK97 family phage portal protein
MKNIKVITRIPGRSEYWIVGNDANKVETGTQSYNKVPLIRRAVDIRCNVLAGLPYHIEGQNGNEIGWIFDQSFRDLLWRTEAALLLHGAAYWLKLSNSVIPKGAEFINPYTVKVKYENKEITFVQEIKGEVVNRWAENEIVYFKEHNPTDDVQPGTPAAKVALNNSQMMHYITNFGVTFFEGGAMPVTMLGIEGNPSPDEIKKVENYFRRIATGIKNAFNVIGLRGVISPQILTPPIDTLAMPELTEDAMSQIAWAFGLRKTLLTDAANLATAETDRRSFYTETVVPHAAQIAETINRQFYGGRAELRFNHQELDLFQNDEAERAQALVQLTNSGLPLKLAMEVLGYDLSDEQWAMVPDETEPEQPTLVQLPMPETTENTRAIHLEQWQRKAINRLKNGDTAATPFESEAITGIERDKIAHALPLCSSEAEVKNLFSEIVYSVN